MKKQTLKLRLKKENVSNLNKVKGGGGTLSVAEFCIDTFTLGGDVCCDQTYPDTNLLCHTVTPDQTCALNCEYTLRGLAC